MEFEQIKELIKQIDESNIDEFTFKQNSTEICIKRSSGTTSTSPANTLKTITPTNFERKLVEVEPNVVEKAPEVSPQKVQEGNLHKISSPMVGTFYASPSPEAENYVKTGSNVDKNTVVCIVEAMKLFNEIEAEIQGQIVEVLVESGQLVEYGQPLFLVRTEVGGN